MSTSNLKDKLEEDFDSLALILAKAPTPATLDQRLIHLANILDFNPGCFITVSPKILKIRDASNRRLAKVVADFSAPLSNIGDRINAKLTSKDIAYLFLFTVKLNGMYDLVKFNYRNSNPRAKEISSITKLKAQIKEYVEKKSGAIQVELGNELFWVDDVDVVENVPKADCVLTCGGKHQIYISHKHASEDKKLVSDSFRQYSGLSRYCLGEFAEHEEVKTFRRELEEGFTDAKINGMVELRKGSYFAKKIECQDLAMAAIFGREFMTRQPSTHNVHAVLQGEMQITCEDGKFKLRGSTHTMINPRLFNLPIVLDTSHYSPHFMATKSQRLNQGHEGTRLSIWPLNSTTVKGLVNYDKFFKEKLYETFKVPFKTQ